jgi:uncharacterized damage-inducible protein DinB
MKSTLLLLATFASASAIYAQNNPLSTELKANYNQIKNNVIKAAEEMPEAEYGFVPGPGSRTYGQAVLHIAEVQMGVCAMAQGEQPKQIDQTKTSKADAIAALKAAFDYCDPIYEALNDQNGLQMAKMFGRDRTRFGILDFGVIHSNEMYGTLAVYLRAKGTVPPSSAGRGGMGKKKQ